MSVARLLGDINARLEFRTKAIKNSVENLLPDVYRRVFTLRAAKKLVEDQLAPDFRIFDYMRDDENGLSRCLADLLDPHGKHGQGSLFLDAFLKRPECADWAKASQCRSVKTEKATNEGRRIDIFMEFDNGVIGIENKPWAGDQPLQLSDYSDWLMAFSGKKKWLLIFLSNRDPEVSNIPADRRGSLANDRYIWPWFVYANGTELDKAFRDWQNNAKPWQAMLDGSLATTMVDIAVKVHDAFKDRMDLLMPSTTAPGASMAPGATVDVGALPNLSAQGNIEMTG